MGDLPARDKEYRVLRALDPEPTFSQRDLASDLKMSVGAANYCLKALIEKGLVKVNNFRAADNRLRYAYVLTPKGMSEKAKLTRMFLARKVEEYETLKSEIETLRSELVEDADGTDSPETPASPNTPDRPA